MPLLKVRPAVLASTMPDVSALSTLTSTVNTQEPLLSVGNVQFTLVPPVQVPLVMLYDTSVNPAGTLTFITKLSAGTAPEPDTVAV